MKYMIYKVYVYDTNIKCLCVADKLFLAKGDDIILENEKGQRFAKVCEQLTGFDSNEVNNIETYSKIIRKATYKDIKANEKNKIDSKDALKKAKELSKKYNLNMHILSSDFTFDRNQLNFNFTSEERVDFRDLAKSLASIYKTRIELRQIGVRDKAKEIGGIGPCGRFLCCNLFLNEFESVSINMAKNQYISLKPDKINGICGRLLCCLNYEDDQYIEEKKKYPPIGSFINYNNSKMKVISHNLFRNTFVVENSEKTTFLVGLKEYEGIK